MAHSICMEMPHRVIVAVCRSEQNSTLLKIMLHIHSYFSSVVNNSKEICLGSEHPNHPVLNIMQQTAD